MPSLFAKIGLSSKPNPYMNPHHPGHNSARKKVAQPGKTGTHPATNAHPSSVSLPLPRQASPRGSSDFLAEARNSAGRNPVTGRRAGGPSQRNNTLSRVSLADELRQVEAEERTMYQNRSLAQIRTMGSKYELYAQAMVKQREEEMRIRAARGGVEYYAPERTLSEFYSAPLND